MRGAVLALDIGGTKIAAALVEARTVRDRLEFATPRESGAVAWLHAIASATERWRGAFVSVGAAVTGFVDAGQWSALNPETLPVPAGFPLEAELARHLRVPARAWNDAQAAAWGEYRFGAAEGVEGATIVFVTISTGVGGGIVTSGRLLTGLAGHFGQWRSGADVEGAPAEACISGRWIAAEAARQGHDADARAVFTAWRGGAKWAAAIIRQSARCSAALLLDIQLALDPARIIIGGSIGLAAGYLDLCEAEFAALPPRLRPRLHPARLGADAGLIGAADLVTQLPPSSSVERV